MKIVGNKNINDEKAIQIFRIAEFINSEFSGFRCSDLFLMRKQQILTVFLEVIANSILIYDMTLLFF